MAKLNAIAKRVESMDPEARAELAKLVLGTVGERLWTPNPGAQTEAYLSEADEIGFGGEAGPGKTDVLIGLSLTEHQRSLILRRTNKEARSLVDRYEELIGHRAGLNANEGIWRLGDRVIHYGGCEHEYDKQKYKGTPHDFIGFDEVVDFSRSQFEFIKQWNRSTTPGQRCRVLATFNPPTSEMGRWVIEYWAPWLDPNHPDPAKSGEIRWFTMVDGKDTEVQGKGPHKIPGEDEPVFARSRTFIRGHLDENPALANTGYDATRAAAPQHLREVYRSGSFESALSDSPGQLIPSAWVSAAVKRWTPHPPQGVPMCAMGVDCSGGGHDPLMIACRYDGWYMPMIETPGSKLDVNRLGAVSVGIILSWRRDEAPIVVDCGGGYGGPIIEKLTENGIHGKAFKGAEAAMGRTRDRKLPFTNKRSQIYWQFREALDPDQIGGSPIMLPDDPGLRADLTALTFEVTPRGIQVEPKEKVTSRLGRSTDKGDAVVMAWAEGPTYADMGQNWKQPKPMPKVLRSYAERR